MHCQLLESVGPLFDDIHSGVTPTPSRCSQTTSRLVDDRRRLLVYILQGAIGSGVMELPLGVDQVEVPQHHTHLCKRVLRRGTYRTV